MYLISGHYRQPLAFSDAALEQARANVSRIREAARRLAPGSSPPELQPLCDRFFDALARDFNTPEAVAVLNEWLRTAAGLVGDAPAGDGSHPADDDRHPVGDGQLREMLAVLGLESLIDPAPGAPEGVRELAEARERSRAARDFAAADRLREEIAAAGWEVRDGPGGFDLVPL